MGERMKVWPNRVPPSLIEAWAARAKREGTDSSAMLRQAMTAALASPRPIMPAAPPKVRPEDCAHPKAERKQLGYATVCGACRRPVR